MDALPELLMATFFPVTASFPNADSEVCFSSGRLGMFTGNLVRQFVVTGAAVHIHGFRNYGNGFFFFLGENQQDSQGEQAKQDRFFHEAIFYAIVLKK